MRVLTGGGLLAATAALASCSLLVKQPTRKTAIEDTRCDYATPTLDVVVGAPLALLGAKMLSNDCIITDSEMRNGEVDPMCAAFKPLGAIPLLIGLAYAVSAASGYTNAHGCSTANRDARALRLAVAQATAAAEAGDCDRASQIALELEDRDRIAHDVVFRGAVAVSHCVDLVRSRPAVGVR